MNKEIKIIRIVRLNSNQNQIQPILNCHYWKQMLNHCMNSHPTDKSIGSQWASHWNLKAVICACSVLGYLLQCSCLSPLATVGCFLLFPVSVTAQLQMVWENVKIIITPNYVILPSSALQQTCWIQFNQWYMIFRINGISWFFLSFLESQIFV